MGMLPRPAPGATTKGFAQDMVILDKNQNCKGRQKYFARPITLSHDEILTNEFLRVDCRTLHMRIAVSHE
jgi:hypothetical protein